jgi:hypothetical protein
LKDDISKLSVQLGYGDPDIITEDESVIFKDQPYTKEDQARLNKLPT